MLIVTYWMTPHVASVVTDSHMLYSLCLWVGLCGPPSPVSGYAHAIDGDTISVSDVRIRLYGIDAPELSEPGGAPAKSNLQHIVGTRVTCHLTGSMSYNRHIGTCYNADGSDVGAEMVRLGFALDCTHYSGGKYKPLEPPDIHTKLIQKPYCL